MGIPPLGPLLPSEVLSLFSVICLSCSNKTKAQWHVHGELEFRQLMDMKSLSLEEDVVGRRGKGRESVLPGMDCSKEMFRL